MRTSPRLVLSGVLLGVALSAGGTALAVDSPYSGGQVDVIKDDRDQATSGGGDAGAARGGDAGATGGVSPTSVTSPATLPFTGGEVLLAAALGGAAVASGAALVLTTRRRPA